LENLIERAMVFVEDNIINIDDLELNAKSGNKEPSPISSSIPQSVDELREQKRLLREKAVEPLERAFLVDAMRRNDGNVTRAAEEVGMQRTNFHALLRKQGITGRELE
jgi:DNA-binding NtrC family response regulator